MTTRSKSRNDITPQEWRSRLNLYYAGKLELQPVDSPKHNPRGKSPDIPVDTLSAEATEIPE